MKKLFTALFAAALLALFTPALTAQAGFDNLKPSGLYTQGLFRDVGETEWYSTYVEAAYNLGLMHGKGGNTFDPGGALTLGEAIKLASCLHSAYYGENAVFSVSEPFYEAYSHYALENGIISEHGDYSAYVTRAQFAGLLVNALPEAAFPGINAVPDFAVCDVVPDNSLSDGIYALYRAGVIAGSDRYGTFNPDSYITRAEACAALARAADPSLRVNAPISTAIPAEVIYERSTAAVFMIETFDEDGKPIRIGSGFFITQDGLAVTNQHVVEGAANAIVTLSDGRMFPVRGVNAISREFDLALISIEYDGGVLSFLRLANSDFIKAGSTIYALGSPQGLRGSITEGSIANTVRELDGQIFFQFTAPISFGSGGGPILNALGQVVGVACSSFTAGQHLNLAVPINLLQGLEVGPCVGLDSIDWQEA